jgi:glucan 1,3-beta-glucosidase
MTKHKTFSGVNLGGWLVLEQWMTPSVFDGFEATNEYELARTADGRKKIQAHQASFIQEADFKWVSDRDITFIRLPVGYWIFGDEVPYVGAIERLDWAVEMAEKYDIKLLIDLHGAPGAQNAADHSGSGHPGLPLWLNDADKQERTIQVLERLVTRYNDKPAVWGIELINEPLADRFGFKLIRFYRRAYKRLQKVARPGLYIVFSDGFKPLLMTGALKGSKRLPIAIDCHLYQCFSERDKQLTFAQHLRKAKKRRWLIRVLQLWQPVIIGEWSGILPWTLLREMSETERDKAQRQFIVLQKQMYKEATACFYWNYKTEKDSAWNFRVLE